MSAPDDHDTDELQRLVRFMTREGRRFGLALATYVDDRVAGQVRDEATQRSGLRVTTVDATSDVGDAPTALCEASQGHEVVHMVGLDGLAFDRDGTAFVTRFVRALNLQRDDLGANVDARVVLWCSAEAYPQLAALAWDLLEVMLTRFEFRGRDPEREALPAPRPKTSLQELHDDDHEDELAWAREQAQEYSTSDPQRSLHASIDRLLSATQLWVASDDLDAARATLERALALHREHKNAPDMVLAHVFSMMAELDLLAGDNSRALDNARHSFSTAEAAADSAATPFGLMLIVTTIKSLLLQSLARPDSLPLLEPRAASRSLGVQLIKQYRENGRVTVLHQLFIQYDALAEHYLALLTHNAPTAAKLIDVFDELVVATDVERPLPNFRHHLFRVTLATLEGYSKVPALPATTLVPQLYLAMDSLDLCDHDLVELHYDFGVPEATLAELFDIVEPTLRYRLSVAVERLLDAHERLTGERLSATAITRAFDARPVDGSPDTGDRSPPPRLG
jgi:hypothetical protein